MRKRKIWTVLLFLQLGIILTLCGGVVAYMFQMAESKERELIPAEVSCEVVETFDGESKSSIQVKNTGNIPVYIRLRLVSYWTEADDTSSGQIVSESSEFPEVKLGQDWMEGENHTYYYKKPVSPDTLTENMLKEPIVLQDKDGYQQVLEVFAEAIQSEPADAVGESWKINLNP